MQVTLKVLFTKPDVQDLEEASVYLSILPIRLNMDQDTVLFLYEFTRQVGNLGLSQCEFIHSQQLKEAVCVCVCD